MQGSLAVTPRGGSEIHLGETVEVQVVLTLLGGETSLPDDAMIELTLEDEWGVLRYPIGTNKVHPVAGQQAGQFSATFYIATSNTYSVDDAPSVRMVITTVGSVNAARQDVMYVTLPPAVVKPLQADRFIMPTRPSYEAGGPDNEEYTVHYSVLVQDSDEIAIEGYLVEWSQQWEVALFANMTAYGSNTAEAEPLEVIYYNSGSPPSDGTVRTKTNADGVADLYLVAGPSQVFVQLRTTALFSSPVQVGAELTVYDYHDVDPNLREPDIPWLDRDVLHLGDVPGQMVGTIIETDEVTPLESLTYTMIINKKPGPQWFHPPGQDVPPEISIPFSKQKVILGAALDTNEIFYVSGSRVKGVSRSQASTFGADGDRGENMPGKETRVLQAPYIPLAGTYVNSNTIQFGLNIVVPVSSPSSEWTAREGDHVTVTIYLNGWSVAGEEISDTQTLEAYYPDKLSADGTAMLFNLSRQYVAGYGPEPSSGRRDRIYVEYSVQRGEEPPIISNIVKYGLDTVPVGQG